MRLIKKADWAFGYIWAAVTAVLYMIASVFVLHQELTFDFILTNLALWSAAGALMAIALGWKREPSS